MLSEKSKGQILKKIVEIEYHKNQHQIFYGYDARFKVVVKGRRFGLTRGMMNYVI